MYLPFIFLEGRRSIHHISPPHVALSDVYSPRPFLPPPWTTTDDRLRGGASQSFLIALPHNGALFYGHLDIATLGGAGFASQYSPTTADDNDTTTSAPARGGDAPWDLTAYAGLEIRLGPGDGKLYTLILKDAENRPRGLEGRETAGFSWEAEFRANAGQTEEQVEKEKIHAGGEEEKGQAVWLPWDEFKPTFRGRETQGGEKLDQSNITTVGIMMRSYFGTQEGDFKLEVESITARKGPPEVHSNGSEEG